MPSSLFYSLNFSFSIFFSICGLFFCVSIVSVITVQRHRWHPSTLLLGNTCVIVSTYLINNWIVSIYGFHEEWAEHQPLCSFRAYHFLMSGVSVCYSYFIQGISRLFFTVFYQHRYLHSYHAHWCLIAANWILGSISAVTPWFFEGGFRYETESRLCTLTTQTAITSMYGMIVGFMVPLRGAYIVYFIIFLHVRRSTRRVTAGIMATTLQTPAFNVKRELKLVRNMLLLMGIFTSAGIPFLAVGFWHAIQPDSPPPATVYLPMINTINFCVALQMFVLFCTNKHVKRVILSRFL